MVRRARQRVTRRRVTTRHAAVTEGRMVWYPMPVADPVERMRLGAGKLPAPRRRSEVARSEGEPGDDMQRWRIRCCGVRRRRGGDVQALPGNKLCSGAASGRWLGAAFPLAGAAGASWRGAGAAEGGPTSASSGRGRGGADGCRRGACGSPGQRVKRASVATTLATAPKRTMCLIALRPLMNPCCVTSAHVRSTNPSGLATVDAVACASALFKANGRVSPALRMRPAEVAESCSFEPFGKNTDFEVPREGGGRAPPVGNIVSVASVPHADGPARYHAL